MKRLQILLAGGILLLFAAAAFGQVTLFPGVRLQGVLKDAGGNPVSGSVTVQVHIYTAPTGGTPLYTETFSRTVSAGLVDLILGVGQGTATGDLQASLAATQTEPERWLGIVVNSDPELSPRAMLNSTPHSFRVGTVDGATGGDISGDVTIQNNLAVGGAMDAKNLVLSNPGPIQTPLSIQGSSGQTANLVEIKDGAGSPLITVGAAGGINAGQINAGAMNAGNLVLSNPGPVQTPLSIQGSSGQTVNLMEIKDVAGTPLITVGAGGAMEGKNLVLRDPGPVQTPLSIQGSSGQTAPLMEIKDASGTSLVKVTENGSGVWKYLISESAGADQTPNTIYGFPGQVANLLEIKNSDGLGLASFGATGQLQVSGVLANDELIVLDDGVGTNPTMKIQGSAGQTANLMEIKDALGTPIVTVKPGGGGADASLNVGARTIISGRPQYHEGGELDLSISNPENIPLTISATTGQTANLTEWRIPLPGGGVRQNVVDELGQSGIGTGSPHSTLHVNGSFATAILQTGCVPITLNETHHVVLVNSPVGGSCTVNLPTALGISGRQYTVKNTGAGTVTLTPASGQTIDGATFHTLGAPNKYVIVVSDGANWQIIGNN